MHIAIVLFKYFLDVCNILDSNRLTFHHFTQMEYFDLHYLPMFCLNTSNTTRGQCFGRAVEVCPDKGYSKYMYLGQLFEGAQAVECFQKGIQLMLKEKEEKQAREVWEQ